jgi:hypothetical protein
MVIVFLRILNHCCPTKNEPFIVTLAGVGFKPLSARRGVGVRRTKLIRV